MIERNAVERTVVFHPGALGDVLLAVPALRALRASAPGGELVLAAQPRVGALLTSLAVVDRHVAFDTLGLETLFTDDDAPAGLRQLLTGARIVSWFGAGDATFVRRLRALVRDAVVASSRPPPSTAVWQHLIATVEPVYSRGATASPGRPERKGGLGGPVEAPHVGWSAPIPVVSASAAEGRRVLTAAGWDGAPPLVMIHPGAGGAGKRWPPEGFAAVIGALVESAGIAVVVHDGPADHDAVAALRVHLRVPAVTLTDVPLQALAGALTHVALWIGNDSGVSHLAAAVGAPTLALFAEANLAWRPWARPARTLTVDVGTSSRLDIDRVVAEATSVLRSSDRSSIGGPASLR